MTIDNITFRLTHSFTFLVCAVREVSPVETGIFFWTFVVVIGFILFNMVLAVIFTVYDEKYGEIHKEMTAQQLEEDKKKGVKRK